MKKLLLSLVLGSSLNMFCTPLGSFQKEKNVDRQNVGNKDNVLSRSDSYNPMYPTFNKNLNVQALAHCFSTDHGDHNDFAESSWTTVVNVLDYSPNKDTFIKNYGSITVSYQSSNFHDIYGIKSYGWTRKSFNDTFDLTHSLNISKEYGYRRVENSHSTDSQSRLELRWNGNELQVKVYAHAWGYVVHKSGTNGIDVKDEPVFDAVKFNSKFSQSELTNRVRNYLEKSYTIKSDTSPNISSDEKNGKAGSLTKSNKELIMDEINERLKTGFGVDYNAWFSGNKPILKCNIGYDDSKNVVTITIKDEQKISAWQYVGSFKMNVNVKLTDLYYQRDSQKRLTVTPGKIVDPNSSFNELINDRPEYDAKTNTLTYHNSVDITFSAISESEILKINGEEVEVYNNVYRKKLDDSRNMYSVVVSGVLSGGQTTDLKLNIKIESLSSQMSYRWLGWKPESNLEQKKLINKTLPDGKPNPDYDYTIDPTTGMRNEFIYIESPNWTKNLSSTYQNFYQDPLDKYGNIIKDYNKTKQGLIVEASVSNSGVTLANEFDMTKVSQVTRIKLDDDLNYSNNSMKNIKPAVNEQWSEEGLWWYIIKLKDYVSKSVDPSNPGVNNVLASGGSTIHKIIYISNKTKDYAKFSSLDFILNHNNVNIFWESLQGKHLKNYLIKYTEINTTQKIDDLSYEQLIVYWKKYVSDQLTQKVDVPQEPVNYKDLSNLNISNLKMNEINPIDVKNKILKHINKYVTLFSRNVVYKSDYFVNDSDGNDIENVDFSNFINLNETNPIKKIVIQIKASNTSTLLIGKKQFTVINNKDFDENKVLDLSTINNLKDIKFNFTDADKTTKDNFIENYIINYVLQILNLYKPKNVEWDYFYKIDYIITIDGTGGSNISDNKNFKQKINTFLSAKEDVMLEIFIVSVDDSIKLSNFTSYKIFNTPSSNNVAPEKPDPPVKPRDPSNPDWNGGNVNETSEYNKNNLYWLISLIIPTVGMIWFIIWYRKNRKNKSIK